MDAGGPTWVTDFSVGAFARPDDHHDLWASAVGGTRHDTPSGWFGEFVAGVGYDARWQIETLSVDIGSGDVTRNRQLQHRLVPHVAMRTGIDRGARVTWFVDVTVGRAFVGTVPNEVWFSTAVGLQVALTSRPARSR